MTSPSPASLEAARVLDKIMDCVDREGDLMDRDVALALLESYAQAAVEAAVREEREKCAQAVPTNWLNGMLTGPNKVLAGTPGRWGCPEVERLLRAVAAAIRSRGRAQEEAKRG